MIENERKQEREEVGIYRNNGEEGHRKLRNKGKAEQKL